jgi:hypothetical protein
LRKKGEEEGRAGKAKLRRGLCEKALAKKRFIALLLGPTRENGMDGERRHREGVFIAVGGKALC